MEQYKEIFADPAKLEAKLKEDWAKIDTKGEGSVTYKELMEAYQKMAKAMNLPENKQPTQEDNEKIKKLIDPQGTGKVNFEGFMNLVKAGAEQLKAAGKA